MSHADSTGSREKQLREVAEQNYRRAERIRSDYITLTHQVIVGLSTSVHEKTMRAGLPICRCGHSLSGGDASGAFITHALTVLAAERDKRFSALMECTDEDLTVALHFLGPEKRASLRKLLSGQ